MAPTDNVSNLSSPGGGGDNDRRGDKNDRRGGNNDRRGGNNDSRRDVDVTPGRRSKRHTSSSTGTPAKKKQKGTTAETPTGPKQNDGNDDNASSQEGATDKKSTEKGVSAENNGDTSNNNNEAEEINKNPVRKPGFSYVEKQVLQSITNTPPFFAVTRVMNLNTITPCHKAVVKKRRTVILK